MVKLDDEILRINNTNNIKIAEPISRNEEINTTINNLQFSNHVPRKFDKAPIGKRALPYFVDSLIMSVLFLPSLYFLFDFYLEIKNSYYEGYNDYSKG